MRTMVVSADSLSLLASLDWCRRSADPGETVDGAVIRPVGYVDSWAARYEPLDDPATAVDGEDTRPLTGLSRRYGQNRETVLSAVRHAEKIVIALQPGQVRQLAHLALHERLRAANPHCLFLVLLTDSGSSAVPIETFVEDRRDTDANALMAAVWRHGKGRAAFEAEQLSALENNLSPMIVSVALCLRADPAIADRAGLALERSLASGLGVRDQTDVMFYFGLADRVARHRAGPITPSPAGKALIAAVSPDNVDRDLAAKIEGWSRLDLGGMRAAIETYHAEFMRRQSVFTTLAPAGSRAQARLPSRRSGP